MSVDMRAGLKSLKVHSGCGWDRDDCRGLQRVECPAPPHVVRPCREPFFIAGVPHSNRLKGTKFSARKHPHVNIFCRSSENMFTSVSTTPNKQKSF